MKSGKPRACIRAVAMCAAMAFLPAAAADELGGTARQQALSNLTAWAEPAFTAPASLALDASLRREIDALVAELRARLPSVFSAWFDDELARSDPSKSSLALSMRLVARFVNVFARWQLDSAGEAHDRLTLRSLQDTGFCRAAKDLQPFAAWVVALQRLAPDERAKGLDALRTVMARWGQPRTPPERPAASLQERAMAAVQRLRGMDRPAAEPALSPMLAWNVLDDKDTPLGANANCLLVNWELQREPTRSETAREQAELVRYARLVDATTLHWPPSDNQRSKDDYPPTAARFGVEGEVQVRWPAHSGTAGANSPQIVSRVVTVPGIRNVRPVAFETLFDAASLERAAKLPPLDNTNGKPREVVLKWKLQ
jgi:hypothetical protein